MQLSLNLDVITGGTASYNNGTSGVNANITIAGGTLTTMDGVPTAHAVAY